MKNAGIEPTKEELTQVVSAVRTAMKRYYQVPMAVMEWIEKEESSEDQN